MKFILNTSFNPHFCVLFDDKNKLIALHHWETPREDGQRIWDFLKEHLPAQTSLSFIGGVSGPGSFASLRAGGAILNSLSFRFAVPIHQARADDVIFQYLESQDKAHIPFVLNSFGDRIFTTNNNTLQAVHLTTNPPDLNQATITSWLPEAKAKSFNKAVEVDPLGPVRTMLHTLEKTTAQPLFVPDYEYPPVQS